MLSIHPVPCDKQAEKQRNDTELFINSIVTYAVPKAITPSEIIKESQVDETLIKVQEAIATNNWSSTNIKMKPYLKIKNELAYKSGII